MKSKCLRIRKSVNYHPPKSLAKEYLVGMTRQRVVRQLKFDLKHGQIALQHCRVGIHY